MYDQKFRGILPEKLGGDVRHASWNPYPISDQNLWFSLPYFRPDQKFDTLFKTWRPVARRVTSCYGTYTVKREMVLSPNDELAANSSQKQTQFKTRVHKPYPISDQNGRNWYPISNQNGQKNITFGAAHTYIAYLLAYLLFHKKFTIFTEVCRFCYISALWDVVHILILRHKISKNILVCDTSAWKRLTSSMDYYRGLVSVVPRHSRLGKSWTLPWAVTSPRDTRPLSPRLRPDKGSRGENASAEVS